MHIPRAVTAAAAAAAPRFVMYYDEWHPASPPKTATAGITHVVTAFAKSTLFNQNPPQPFQPFVDVATLRAMFDEGTKVCVAIGGWGDTAGFSLGHADENTRDLYASAVATTVENLGYDCVDIDWEYPGGNGEDYKQNPNEGKVAEIANYVKLLTAIKSKIGDKELSIAVPGLERDMIAYTAEQVPLISDAVDMVNIMAYDLMNRRDTTTKHHTSVKGSLATVDKYIELGMDAAKMNLGFALYAKFFETTGQCSQPIGCETVLLEDATGTDTLKSGAVTFFEGVPVLSQGIPDDVEGGMWFWESSTSKFWTWDSPTYIKQKFEQIIKARGLGGAMAWSLGEDSSDYAYISAIRENLALL